MLAERTIQLNFIGTDGETEVLGWQGPETPQGWRTATDKMTRHGQPPGQLETQKRARPPCPQPSYLSIHSSFTPNPINAPGPLRKTQLLRPPVGSEPLGPSWTPQCALEGPREGVGLIHPRGHLETTPPFQVLSPLERVTTGPGVTSQQLLPNLNFRACLQVLGAGCSAAAWVAEARRPGAGSC